MPKGGARKGAGRPPGSLTRRTREIADRAAAEGKLPLEVMLENMRHFQQAALDAEAILFGLSAEEFTGRDLTPEEQFKKLLAEVQNAANLRQLAGASARDAAPFMHARLTAVTHSGSVDVLHQMSDDELERIAASSRDRASETTKDQTVVH